MATPSTSKKTWKIGLLVVLSTLATGIAGFLIFRSIFPLTLHTVISRWEVSRSGVERLTPPDFDYLAQDRCQGKNDCVCIGLIHGLGDDAMGWKRIFTEKSPPQGSWSLPAYLVAPEWPSRKIMAEFRYDPTRPLPPSELRVRSMARNLLEFLKTTKPAQEGRCRSWTLVGHSFGGWIASWMALEWKDHGPSLPLEKIALLAPSGLEKPESKFLSQPTVEGLKEFQKLAFAQPREISARGWDQAVARLGALPLKQIIDAQTEEDLLAGRLTFLKTTTFILAGLADQIMPLEKLEKFSQATPGSILQKVENCGHSPQKECPSVVIQMLNQLHKHGAF